MVKTETPKAAYLYFFSVGALTISLSVLYALTIDWSRSNVFIAVFQTFAIGYLLWAVADVIVEVLFLLVFRLWKGPLKHRRMDMSKGIPAKHRTSVAYMLRSNHFSECEEAFDNMYRSYMDNLDVNGNLTAILVSASSPLSIVQYEMDLRDHYREQIRRTLLSEANDYKQVYSQGAKLESDDPRADFWSTHFQRWRAQGLTQAEIITAIEMLVQRIADDFKYLHRTNTTLKKAGQYQDLMLLSSRGIDKPFTYLEAQYGTRGRSPDAASFGFFANLENDQALSTHEFNNKAQALELRGAQDILELKKAGLSYGATADKSYRYTVLLDADNRCPAGAIRTLVEIAAANPERGFLQTGLLVSNMDTWHSFREILAYHSVSKLPEALFRTMGRFGDYGKGLADNHMYIEQFIGTAQKPKETLPVDILSHDTIEALYLNPAYVLDVYFYEGVTSNVFSRQAQLTRWARGDLMNAILLLPKTVGRVFALGKKFFGNRESDHLSTTFKMPETPFAARYIAHLSSRALLRAPLFFLWIFIETFGRSILVHTNPVLMSIHFYFILFGLVLLPKMYAPSLDFMTGISRLFQRQTGAALDALDSASRGFVAAWIEILSTPLVYMPDILHSPLRLWSAAKSMITGQAGWKVQAEVERETQDISFLVYLRKTWGYPAVATGFLVALWLFGISSSILLIALLLTWLLFPVTVWLGARPMSPWQRNHPFLLWLLKDTKADRLGGADSQSVFTAKDRQSLLIADKNRPLARASRG